MLFRSHSVADVGFGSEAHDAVSITSEDADVVNHGSFFYKLSVRAQFGMRINDSQSLVGDFSAVLAEDMFQFVVFWVIFVYDALVVHVVMLVVG